MSEFTSTAEDLVEEGLRLYSRGQLDQALAKWRLALSRSPGLKRAREYIQYVEDNREALEQTFAAANVMVGHARGDPRAADGLPARSATASSSQVPSKSAAAVQRGGAAGGNLLSEMNWGRVRRPSQAEPATTRSRRSTPAVLLNDGDDDLTPRIDVLSQAKLLRTGVAPPLAPPSAGDAGQRVLMPVAHDDLAGDFDAPEPTTGKLAHGPPVEIGLPPPYASVPAPEPAMIEGDDGGDPQLEAGAVTPQSIFPGSAGPRRGFGADRSNRARVPPSPASGKHGDRYPADGGPAPLELDIEGFGQAEFASAQVTSDVLRSSLEVDLPPEGRSPPPLVPRPPPLPLAGLEEDVDPAAARPWPADDEPFGAAERRASPRSTLPMGVEPAGAARPRSSSLPALAPAGASASARPNQNAEEGVDGMLEGARQLFEQGTFEGSLWLCERVLAKDTGNKDARGLLERNQQVLLQQYREKLADLEQVPVVRIPQQEIIWHKLDHRAGFLLSRVDGVLSYGDILDISGMSNFEAYRILAQLLDQGVIGSTR